MRLLDNWKRMTNGRKALLLFGALIVLAAYSTYHSGSDASRWAKDGLLFLATMFAAVILGSALLGFSYRLREIYRRFMWRKGFEAGMRLEDSGSGYLGEPLPPHRFCLSCSENVKDTEGMAAHLRQNHAVVWIARWEKKGVES